MAFLDNACGRFLLTAALALGCAREPLEDLPAAVTPEAARLVSTVTSGTLPSRGAVRARFAGPMIDTSLAGHPLKKRVFAFTPAIDGTALWETTRDLVFRPDRPLPPRKSYRGRLDLSALLPDRPELPPLDFDFTVAGREILSLEGDFDLTTAGDPKRLVYRGRLELTEAADLDLVRRAATLRRGEDLLPLAWEAGGEGRVFSFTSAVMERDTTDQRYLFAVDHEELETSHRYEREIPLAPLREMRLERVEKDEEGDVPRLVLVFSDELDPRQDLEGLVRAPPAAEIRLKASGKEILVDGDFAHGRRYELAVHPGIRSRWGTRTGEETRRPLGFSDRKPELRFARDGVFLPSSRDRRLRFATLNLARVFVEVKKVFASNLGPFLQDESLASGRERRHGFSHRVRRVGVQVALDTLEIPDGRNTWLEHELDLEDLIDRGERGVFLVELRFGRQEMLYRPGTGADEIRRHYGDRPRGRGRDYYSDPTSDGYVRARGRAAKALIVSDIGLTWKRGPGRHLVYATRLDDARPLAGVEVTLRTYQNQAAAAGVTDERGLATFDGVADRVFYVEGEHGGQRSLVQAGNRMAWNLSTFDVGGGDASPGPRAFLYTERGVYRPGDEINLSVIARHPDYTFPGDHPAACRIFNPQNQMVFEQVRRGAREGLYTFSFATGPEDPTGTWRARVRIGDSTFDHLLKVETVVPYRLRTEIAPEPERLGRGDEILKADLRSAYLFGRRAAGLEAELRVLLRSAPKSFPRFEGFTFANEAIDYRPVSAAIFKGRLDDEGRARAEWTLPDLAGAPSGLEAALTARVLEKGGRPNHGRARVPVDPYDYYVGLKKPDLDYGYARVGEPVAVPVVATDVDGQPAAGRSLRCRVYRGATHWWWEHENRQAFRRRFKSDRRTEMVSEERIVSAPTPVELRFEPEERGEYLIEVADGGDRGHAAAFFLGAHPWGGAAGGEGGEGALALRTDRERYRPGDEAVIRFPVPGEGSVLFSVEQGGRVLDSRWYRLDGRPEARIPVPVTAGMIPTAYAAVSVIQPYAQTRNDRPLRLFGVVPIEVHDPETALDFDIRMPEVLRPGQPFEVEVVSSAPSAAFTLAVVDEGLLALTDFATPDPWKAFFRKQRLGVRTFDLFAHVIGAVRGDPFRVYSIGGGMAAKRVGREEARSRRRFPPVSMFAGPLSTDASGRARVGLTMPNYAGAVRAMVVGARGRRFGRAENTAQVKSDLMVLSTLPRVLGPGDRVEVPVTLFAMADSLGAVDVSIEVDGPLRLAGEARRQVEFAVPGERDLTFELEAAPAVGPAAVLVEAVSASGARASRRTDLEVRASSPVVYESDERPLRPGETVSFTVPDKGLAGTNRARVSVRRRPGFNFDNQMLGLVRYPYGCLEQIVSSAFPQLYLKDLVDLKPEERRIVAADVDERVNEAILQLRRFRLPDGSFSLWPGQPRHSSWGSAWAGHFLVEARGLGYHVPAELLQEWLRGQHARSVRTRDPLTARVYRVYLLALAGDPALGAMNLLKENELASMSDLDKWLLASAYRLAGVEETADEIARGAGLEVEDYQEPGATYGSRLRDKALILDAQILFQRWEAADELAVEVAQGVTRGWHSTQTTGAALMALGRYVRALRGQRPPAPITGTIRLPGGEPVPFRAEGLGYRVEIDSGFGGQVEVRLDPAVPVERAFAALDWEGVPPRGQVPDEEGRIDLSVEWLDEDGMAIDADTLAQGTAFWLRIRVENGSPHHGLEEVALTQLLPAGWEIESPRLPPGSRPPWMKDWRLHAEEHLDARDDRADWFFDLPPAGQPLDFALKLSAVTRGTFALPPTQVEAMYDREFRARRAGGTVVVR